MEYFPRIHHIGNSRRDPEHDDLKKKECEPEQCTGRIIFMSMYNDIVWEEKRKQRNVYCEFFKCSRICKKIRARTLVISWAWITKEMVRNSHVQAERVNRIALLRT